MISYLKCVLQFLSCNLDSILNVFHFKNVNLYTGSSFSTCPVLKKTRPVCLESNCRPSHAASECVFPIFIMWFCAFLQGLAAVHGLLCTIPWHKLPLLSTEFRLQKTCGVYVSVYLISASDLGHSDTGEFWSFDLTRRDVAVKVECEIISGFLPSSEQTEVRKCGRVLLQRLQVIQSIAPINMLDTRPSWWSDCSRRDFFTL